MGAQVFDSEVREKITPVIDLFRDDLQKTMTQGVENTLEAAREAGSGKLERNCQQLSEATVAFNKVSDSLMECLENYLAILKRHEDQLD